MTFALGPVAGWIALALIPLAAAGGWITRRFVKGAFRSRMRPHYFLGYAALVLTLVHLATSMGSMGGANSTGIWLATFALLGLGWQALIGTNLQSPGGYRIVLRRWHLVTFVAVAIFAVGHVALNR
ncbi:MAG: hypothetical protein WA814_05040 [Candidatus Baltobacteraceae bacterium]